MHEGDHHAGLFSMTCTIIGLHDQKYLIWLACAESKHCDVMIRSFYTGKQFAVRDLVPGFKDTICNESFQLVNIHSENMDMIEFGLKCGNIGEADTDWLFRIDDEDVRQTIVHGYELQKVCVSYIDFLRRIVK
jgi:hypothetical protein